MSLENWGAGGSGGFFWRRLHGCAEQQIGPAAAAQIVVLALLHEAMGYGFDELVVVLQCPSDAAWAQAWQSAYVQYGVPMPIPIAWAAVRALFATPPPRLEPAALRQWYRRQWQVLVLDDCI